MKTYFAPDRLRLVGKAWEVRATLNRLLDRSDARTATLSSLLSHVETGIRRRPEADAASRISGRRPRSLR